MISLLLLLLSITLSNIMSRIGAIALELTGLPEEQAAFQALSATSGVGYTTKEAEFILSHPQRRKIISSLIDFGSAGIITTIATLVGTILSGQSIAKSVSAKPIAPWLPLNSSQLFLLVTVAAFYAFYRALHTPGVARLFKEIISAALLKSKFVEPVTYEEVLTNAAGSGVFQIEITPSSPLAGKTLGSKKIQDQDIKALYVQRSQETINLPGNDFTVKEGDVMVVYGPVAAVHDQFYAGAQPVEKNDTEKAGEPLAELTPAPDFVLKDQNGKTVKLKDFHGKEDVILVFYPMDKSYFCSIQLRELSLAYENLTKQGAEVLAINPQSSSSHAQFCQSSKINFPLLTDKNKKVCKVYKALTLGGLVVDRTVYIIDKNGVVRYARRGRPSLLEIQAALARIHSGKP